LRRIRRNGHRRPSLSHPGSVGSEVYGAVCAGRLGVGVELKPYYRRAVKNLRAASSMLGLEEQLELTEDPSAVA
jgi:hypothetical protein